MSAVPPPRLNLGPSIEFEMACSRPVQDPKNCLFWPRFRRLRKPANARKRKNDLLCPDGIERSGEPDKRCWKNPPVQLGSGPISLHWVSLVPRGLKRRAARPGRAVFQQTFWSPFGGPETQPPKRLSDWLSHWLERAGPGLSESVVGFQIRPETSMPELVLYRLGVVLRTSKLTISLPWVQVLIIQFSCGTFSESGPSRTVDGHGRCALIRWPIQKPSIDLLRPGPNQT
jgi:hypothetical protein